MNAGKSSLDIHGSGASATPPKYQAPLIQVMDEAEVLTAFQMSAAKIGAAGCWWSGCNMNPVEEDT